MATGCAGIRKLTADELAAVGGACRPKETPAPTESNGPDENPWPFDFGDCSGPRLKAR